MTASGATSTGKGPRSPWRLAGAVAVGLALCALMALHAPGHLSVDSLIQLDEGYSRRYVSWNPPAFSLFLGTTYALFGRTEAALLVSQALLLAATYRLVASPAASVALRLAAFLSVLAVPVVLIYAGILWKDVFFAHLALAGFAVLHREGVHRRHVFVAALLLGAAATMRQQGMVLVFPLLGYAWWFKAEGIGQLGAVRRNAIAVALSGFLGGYVLVNAVVKATAVDMPAAPYGTGVQLIQRYDIAGILYRDSQAELARFEAAPGFERSRLLEFVHRGYSPQRMDYLDQRHTGVADGFQIGDDPETLVSRQWRALLASHPLTYLAHRADVFGWMLGLHDPIRCLPFIDFVSPEPPEIVERFGLKAEPNRAVRAITSEASLNWYRPVVYPAAGGIALVGFLLWRRATSPRRNEGPRSAPRSVTASSGVIPTLYVAGLLYGVIHFAAGIACDFRYLYFPVLASIVTAAYVFWAVVADCVGAVRRTMRAA